MSPTPPLTFLGDLDRQLLSAGYAVLDAASLRALAALDATAPARWAALWQTLPPDPHLRDGGRYRYRRHGCFVVVAAPADATTTATAPARVSAAPARPHWQPIEYNALHGGLERWFEPLPPALARDPDWAALLAALGGVAARLRGSAPDEPWYVEAHPFRIDTADGIGRPTPEGAHRDGVDLVAVVLVERHAIKGGETRVFDVRGPQGLRFTLDEPWSVLLLDDERVIHESTPIQPLAPGVPGWRDTLVLTFRRDGFQGPG
ncbi:MAG: 2OG-Fe dioxygenase family protein [Rubrivivax sp.]